MSDWHLFIQTQGYTRDQLNQFVIIEAIAGGCILFAFIILIVSMIIKTLLDIVRGMTKNKRQVEIAWSPFPTMSIFEVSNKSKTTHQHFLCKNSLLFWLGISLTFCCLLYLITCSFFILCYEFVIYSYWLSRLCFSLEYIQLGIQLYLLYLLFVMWISHEQKLYDQWIHNIHNLRFKHLSNKVFMEQEVLHLESKDSGPCIRLVSKNYYRVLVTIALASIFIVILLFAIVVPILRMLPVITDQFMIQLQTMVIIPLYLLLSLILSILIIVAIARHLALHSSCHNLKEAIEIEANTHIDNFSDGQYKRLFILFLIVQIVLATQCAGLICTLFAMQNIIQLVLIRFAPLILIVVSYVIITLPCMIFCNCYYQYELLQFVEVRLNNCESNTN